MTNKEIARQLGVSESTVERYMARHVARAHRSMPEDMAVARAEVFSKYSEVAKEAWEEYKRSKEPRIEITMDPVPIYDDDGHPLPESEWPVKVTRREVQRIGDERLLGRVVDCWDRAAKLFGLHKPVEQKLDVSMEAKVASVFALVQHVQEHGNALPTVISSSGQVMVRDMDGVPRLPSELGGNGDGKPSNGEDEPCGS